MSSGGSLNSELSERTFVLGLKVWVLIGIGVGVFTVLILLVLPLCLTARKKPRRALEKLSHTRIPPVSKEIKEVRVEQASGNNYVPGEGILPHIHDKSGSRESDKALIHMGMGRNKNTDNSSQRSSFNQVQQDGGSQSGEEGSSQRTPVYTSSSSSQLTGLPEFSQLGWGHWFTLRDLELATNRFSEENVLGEGGYGIVYRGQLLNGTPVAVKKILDNV